METNCTQADALVCIHRQCEYCSKPFTSVRTSAKYCSDAHKKAHLRGAKLPTRPLVELAGQKGVKKGRQLPPYLTGENRGFSSSQPTDYIDVDVPLTQKIEKVPIAVDGLEWVQVNDVTMKLTDAKGKPLAVLAEIGWAVSSGARWLVRCGSTTLGPYPLRLAKRAAVGLATGVIKGRVVPDPISHLNRLSAGVPSVEEVLLNEKGAPL